MTDSYFFAWFFVGLFTGLTVDGVWMFSGWLPDKKIERWPRLGFLTWLEHYHHALWLTAVNYLVGQNPFLMGVGAALVVAERFQDHPFAFGSSHFLASTKIGILVFLFLIVVLRFG